jgi:hypothetical protein
MRGFFHFHAIHSQHSPFHTQAYFLRQLMMIVCSTKQNNMKKISIAALINRIAIAMLLLASAGFHVQQALKAKNDESLNRPAHLFSQSSFPAFIFPEQNLINHKPIYLCVK